jgi:glycosyltransferase involved in cell wall biosynthesis
LKKITMIVWNEFLNDARVLKEAETLSGMGYLVTVHALHTPGLTKERETLASGIRVVRVARSPFWKWRKRELPSTDQASQSITKKAVGPISKVSHKMLILRIVARLWTHVGLIFQMIKSQPDIVHAHDVNTLPTGWLVSVLTRSPLIYDAHEISTDREGYASFRSIVGWVEKHLMPRAAASITTTDTRAKFFARAYGVPRPLVLQNRPRYELVERSQRIRNELNLQETWPIVLYQGGLQQGRGLERLVEAAAQVSNSYFVFIGGGRIESVLKELAHSLGLENRVYFIPTVSLADLPSYTASADIGVQPIENTCLNHLSTDSNKLFEYMMAGLPVVASSLPEIRTLVSEHELGLLVEPGSISELAFAICRLVGNDDLRHKFEKNAAIASQHLNWDEQEGALLSLYKDVLVGTY